jgi:hypothetical protein
MRTLVHLSGILNAASGGWVGLAGCGIGAGWLFSLGLIVFVVGWQIANAAGKKTCPQCAEQVISGSNVSNPTSLITDDRTYGRLY